VATVLVDLGAAPTAWGQLTLVAQEGPEFGKASPIGLVVILLLAVATVFLIRSMSKRIRRLPASFDPPEDAGSEEPKEGGRPAEPASANDADDPGSGRV
jgi:hypothetical protein